MGKYPWLAWLLGGIFLVAGVSKLGQGDLVFAGIMQYQVVDTHVAFWIADTLPWLEIGLGIALWISPLRGWALGLAMGLQLIFLGALAQATYRGLEVVCVCFGKGIGSSLGVWIQELLLLGITVGAFLHHRTPRRK